MWWHVDLSIFDLASLPPTHSWAGLLDCQYYCHIACIYNIKILPDCLVVPGLPVLPQDCQLASKYCLVQGLLDCNHLKTKTQLKHNLNCCSVVARVAVVEKKRVFPLVLFGTLFHLYFLSVFCFSMISDRYFIVFSIEIQFRTPPCK